MMPRIPNRLLAFGGTSRNWSEADTFGWIWESTDGGENWRHIGTISEDGFSTEAKKGANIHGVQYEPGSKTRLHLRTGAATGSSATITDAPGAGITRRACPRRCARSRFTLKIQALCG
jgi:hypothetical protein